MMEEPWIDITKEEPPEGVPILIRAIKNNDEREWFISCISIEYEDDIKKIPVYYVHGSDYVYDWDWPGYKDLDDKWRGVTHWRRIQSNRDDKGDYVEFKP